MVGILTLWLPILLSAVVVFLASSVIHMVLRYHWTDMAKMPGEDGILEAARTAGLAPGDYSFPHAACMADLKKPETAAKFEKGPVGFLTVLPSGPPAMTRSLVLWIVYTLAVGFMVAYVTGRTLPPGTHYLQVFRVAGSVAFLGYAGAQPIESIWKGRRWSTTVKNVFDGWVYGMLTAGVFGWLWPH